MVNNWDEWKTLLSLIVEIKFYFVFTYYLSNFFFSSFFPFFSSPWRQTLGCLAKQRPLLKNILSSFFILRLLISSILRGKTLDAHSRKDRPSQKKNKTKLVLLYIAFCLTFQFGLPWGRRWFSSSFIHH